MKTLIVTADDFGLTARVNEAVACAYREGVVTTASLMVTGAAFDSAVGIARQTPGLDLGLHLNLTEGQAVGPVAKVASLANSDGFIYKHPLKLSAAVLFGKVRLADLELEIRSQIEKAISSGLQITHIDGHKHVHAMPAVLRLILSIAPEYGVHGIRCVKETVPNLRSVLARNRGSRGQIALQYGFGKALAATWSLTPSAIRAAHVVTPQRFYGITQTGFLDFESVGEVLDDLGDGMNELMCHPGYVDDDLKRTPTRLHLQRERELELVTSSRLRDLIRRKGITLGSYKDLLEIHGRSAAREDYGRRDDDSLLHRDSTV
jgi:hopanoid biosynthesis associated protein HpnK